MARGPQREGMHRLPAFCEPGFLPACGALAYVVAMLSAMLYEEDGVTEADGGALIPLSSDVPPHQLRHNDRLYKFGGWVENDKVAKYVHVP